MSRRATLCNNCDSRTCLATGLPCPEVEALLPSPCAGRSDCEWIGLTRPDRITESSSRTRREASDDRRFLMRVVDRHVWQLSDRERLAAVLIWGLGCSLNTAAARLGVSKCAVQTYMRRTLAKMFDLVSEMQDAECGQTAAGRDNDDAA